MQTNFKLLLHYKRLGKSILISIGVFQIVLDQAHDHLILFFFPLTLL